MRSAAVGFGCALSTALILAISAGPGLAKQDVASELIYAAQNDGTIHVYDIDDHHAGVQVIGLFSCCADVRGISAAAPTHRVYVMYNRDDQGHVAAVDLVSGQVLWDRVLHTPGVDRGQV